MAAAVYHRAFFLRVAAPQHEHDVLAMRVKLGDDAVGKRFPAKVGVRMRLVGAHGEHGVEQQHALLRPMV